MIVGIDLGTTFCAVAHLDDRGKPTTVPNRDGDILTPSAVYLSADGHAVVGHHQTTDACIKTIGARDHYNRVRTYRFKAISFQG